MLLDDVQLPLNQNSYTFTKKELEIIQLMSRFHNKWKLQDAFQIFNNMRPTNFHSNESVKKRLDRIYIDSRIRRKLKKCRLLQEFKQIWTYKIMAISFQIQKKETYIKSW